MARNQVYNVRWTNGISRPTDFLYTHVRPHLLHQNSLNRGTYSPITSEKKGGQKGKNRKHRGETMDKADADL